MICMDKSFPSWLQFSCFDNIFQKWQTNLPAMKNLLIQRRKNEYYSIGKKNIIISITKYGAEGLILFT